MSWVNGKVKMPANAAAINNASMQVLNHLSSDIGALMAINDKAKWPVAQSGELANNVMALRQQLSQLSTSGQELTVHPWQYTVGKKDKSGSYLSPSNAVKRLAEKLNDNADANLVNHPIEAVGIMVFSTDLVGFIGKLTPLCELIATSGMKQAMRIAIAYSGIESSKMQKGNAIINPYWPKQGEITPSVQRTLKRQLVIQSDMAASAGTREITNTLSILLAKRKQKIADISKAWSDLRLSGQLMAFSATGTPEQIANSIKQGVPTEENIYTTATLFLGQDLSLLKELFL